MKILAASLPRFASPQDMGRWKRAAAPSMSSGSPDPTGPGPSCSRTQRLITDAMSGNVMLGLAARSVARAERVAGILGQPI